MLAFLALIAACFVFARRFRALGQRGWARYSGSTGVVCLVLSAWPDMDWSSVRLFVAAALGFAWMAALALQLKEAAADAAR